MFGRKKDTHHLRYVVGTLLDSKEMRDHFFIEIKGEQEYSGVQFGVDLEKSDVCRGVLQRVSRGSRHILLYQISGGGHYHNQLVGFWRIAE